MLMVYLPFLNFSCLFLLFEEFAKQANVLWSFRSSLFVLLFLEPFKLSVIKLYLWFIANLQENWSKLAETQRPSVNED